MRLPITEQTLTAKMWNIPEEWILENFDRWLKVYNIFDQETSIIQGILEYIGEPIYLHDISSINEEFSWIEHRVSMLKAIEHLKEILKSYQKWFPKEEKPFSYYEQLAEQCVSKSHED